MNKSNKEYFLLFNFKTGELAKAPDEFTEENVCDFVPQNKYAFGVVKNAIKLGKSPLQALIHTLEIMHGKNI